MLDYPDFLARYDRSDVLGQLAEVPRRWRELVTPTKAAPKGAQTHVASRYGTEALKGAVGASDLGTPASDELDAAGRWLEAEVAAWQPSVATADNEAKRLAEALMGHAVVLYAGPTLVAAATDWKRLLNTVARNLAFCSAMATLGGSEMAGWDHPERTGLKVVELRSRSDKTSEARFEAANRQLSSAFAPIQVMAAGETTLQQVLWTVMLGQYVAAYLACLNAVDPATGFVS